MKFTSSLCLALLAAVSLPTISSADVENEIDWGFEAVTGFRSEYTHRGFQVADGLLDFQLEGELALNNHTFLNLGAWYATETGQGDFDEAAFFAHLRFRKSDELTIGLSATYRSYGNYTPLGMMPMLDDGLDAGAFVTWHPNRDFSATLGAYYDTGAEGWYSHLEAKWSKAISEDAFVSLKAGVSYVDDYYGRDGANDAYARLSLTYHISEKVSVSPFVGTSILLDNDDPGDDSTYGGLLFIVRF